MDLKQVYREIVNEHNLYPAHKHDPAEGSLSRRGVNPTCGDDITLSLSFDDEGKISEASFSGSGCAVSQASTDIMIDQITGLGKEEALQKVKSFMGMIHGTATPEEIEKLDEAAALEDVAHMPARAKCATLCWHTLEKMLDEEN